MDRTRLITVGLVAFACAGLAMVAGNCIGKSSQDQAQLNYLHNTFEDFKHPTAENWQQRKNECVDMDDKSARYLRAGASADDIERYHFCCESLKQ